MLTDSQSTVDFAEQELECLNKMEILINQSIVNNTKEAFNVLRWCYAYNGDLELAAKKYKRHQQIRKILRLDQIFDINSGHEIDELAEEYAPLTYLGNTQDDQICPVFIEQSGAFDLTGMMDSIRLTSFINNKFRQMEGIIRKIQDVEQQTGRMSSAILILDLKGLGFQSNLASFISGPFRIIWGTLMEQYPFIFKKFIIINTPTFMNILWTACSSFIPTEYKEKIHLLNGDYSTLHQHVNINLFPQEYGGSSQITIKAPIKCNVSTIQVPEKLDSVCIPAGKSIVHTFYLPQGQDLQFYLVNPQEFTLNMFYSVDKRVLTNPQKDVEELEEVYAGCERPGLTAIDTWTWKALYTGFYHVIFGNEKAWMMSVTLEYQLFQLHPNGNKVKINPISN